MTPVPEITEENMITELARVLDRNRSEIAKLDAETLAKLYVDTLFKNPDNSLLWELLFDIDTGNKLINKVLELARKTKLLFSWKGKKT